MTRTCRRSGTRRSISSCRRRGNGPRSSLGRKRAHDKEPPHRREANEEGREERRGDTGNACGRGLWEVFLASGLVVVLQQRRRSVFAFLGVVSARGTSIADLEEACCPLVGHKGQVVVPVKGAVDILVLETGEDVLADELRDGLARVGNLLRRSAWPSNASARLNACLFRGSFGTTSVPRRSSSSMTPPSSSHSTPSKSRTTQSSGMTGLTTSTIVVASPSFSCSAILRATSAIVFLALAETVFFSARRVRSNTARSPSFLSWTICAQCSTYFSSGVSPPTARAARC